MRAGKLDRVLTIERYLPGTPDRYGTVADGFATPMTLRAQVVKSSTEEFMQIAGTMDKSIVIFRIRFLAGVTTADRVTYDGVAFDIREAKEIGRRRALELRCEAK